MKYRQTFLRLVLASAVSFWGVAYGEAECRPGVPPTFTTLSFNRTTGLAVFRSDLAGADRSKGKILFVQSAEDITAEKCSTMVGLNLLEGQVWDTGPNATPPRVTYGHPTSLCRKWVAACFIPCAECSPGTDPAPQLIGKVQLTCVGPTIYTRARFTDGTAAPADFSFSPNEEFNDPSLCLPRDNYTCHGYQTEMSVNISVQPRAGRFLNWAESCSGATQPCVLQAAGPKQVTAVIEKPTSSPLYTRTIYSDGTPANKTLTFNPVSSTATAENCPPVEGYTCRAFPYAQSVRVFPGELPVRYEGCTPSGSPNALSNCTATAGPASRVTVVFERPALTRIYVRTLKEPDRTPYGSVPYEGLVVQFPASKRADVNVADCPPLAGYTCFSRVPDWASADRVRLAPVGDHVAKFIRWEEDCSGSSSSECLLGPLPAGVTSVKKVTAIFGDAGRFDVRLVNASQGKALVRNERGLNTQCTERTCTYTDPVGTSFTVEAVPKTGFKLKEWQGGCSGTNPVCVARSNNFVAAIFEEDRVNFKRLNVHLERPSGAESSRVMVRIGEESLDLTAEFSRVLPVGTEIRLEPRPTPLYRAEFLGSCEGQGSRCTLTISEESDRADDSPDGVVDVTVRFSADPNQRRILCIKTVVSSGCPVNVDVNRSPGGTSVSSGLSGVPSGYNCYGYPDATSAANAIVQLNAVVGPGDVFEGWADACASRGTLSSCGATPASTPVLVTARFRGAACQPVCRNRYQSCAASSPCCAGEGSCLSGICQDAPPPTTAACRRQGQSCNASSPCCTGEGTCTNGTCQIPVASSGCRDLGGSCGLTASCCSPYVCNANTCSVPASTCQPNGRACSSIGDCCSLTCNGGICGGAPVPTPSQTTTPSTPRPPTAPPSNPNPVPNPGPVSACGVFQQFSNNQCRYLCTSSGQILIMQPFGAASACPTCPACP